jgi:hypothetical protein
MLVSLPTFFDRGANVTTRELPLRAAPDLSLQLTKAGHRLTNLVYSLGAFRH